MNKLLRLLPLFLVVMLLGDHCAPAQGHARNADAESHYLYLLSGDAILVKLDTITRHKVATVRLAKHSTLIPVHGDVANSVVDGGSVYGAVYDAITRNMYTLAPTTGSEQGGMRRFRVLGFHIPDLRMVVAIDLPGTFEEGEPPMLAMDRNVVTVEAHGSLSRLEANRLSPRDDAGSELPASRRPTSPGSLRELDLSMYRQNESALPESLKTLAYTPLERCGDVVLIESPSIAPRRSFLVVNRLTRSIALLHLPFSTTSSSVHLVPGGETVLVQEATYGKIPDLSFPAGRMALLQSRTGALIRTWDEPTLSKAYVFTVTPHGDLAFYNEGHVGLLATGVASRSQPVTSIANRSGPWFFYAPQ